MLSRLAVCAALIALAGCAGMESAGRTASRTPQAEPVAAAPAQASSPAPPPSAAPVQVAPMQTAPVPMQPAQAPPPAQTDQPVTTASRAGDENVVVPGARERQVPAPGGDPRSNAERIQDIRSWDQCVMHVQNAAEADPLSPQLETPEDYCRNSLGMANRTAVPQSRLERR